MTQPNSTTLPSHSEECVVFFGWDDAIKDHPFVSRAFHTGEEPIASGSIEDVENRMLEFLGQPEVKDRFRMYRQLLDDAGEPAN